MDLHHRLFGTPTAADDDARWAASGAMALTGSEAPSLPPRSLMPVLRSLETELAARTAELGSRVELDAAALLGERSAIAGLTRRGRTSCGGSTRLLPARDAWMAVALPRPDDVALVPAWLGTDQVASGIETADAGELVEAAALLGLACGRLGETSASCPAVRWRHHRAGPSRGSLSRRAGRRPVGPLGGTTVRARPDERRRRESSRSRAHPDSTVLGAGLRPSTTSSTAGRSPSCSTCRMKLTACALSCERPTW